MRFFQAPFRLGVFVIVLLVMLLLAFIGILGVGGEDAGMFVQGSPWYLAVWIFKVLSFPTYQLLQPFDSGSIFLLLGGLFLNCLLYASLVERTFAVLRARK